jgi:N-formylmaleamate deformylase
MTCWHTLITARRRALISSGPTRRLAARMLLVLAAGCAARSVPARPASDEHPSFTVNVSGHGRPVVFINDLYAPGEVWDTTLEHLEGRVESHVLEIAGFAGNPASPGRLMAQLRADLADYLRERDKRGAVLVGHMFGGSVAWWLAMTEPDLIGGVVSIDAPPSRGDGTPERAAEMAKIRDRLAEATPDEFARRVANRISQAVLDTERARWLSAVAARSSQSQSAEAFYDSLTLDLRVQIGNVRAPSLTFLTTGNLSEEDLPVAEKLYRDQLSRLERHRLLIVRGSRHYLMYDDPEAFFGALDEFLAETENESGAN